jgi:hypothetical protein
MNVVEIEQAISALAEREFDAAEFPYAFLEAFGNKETTIRNQGILVAVGETCEIGKRNNAQRDSQTPPERQMQSTL